MEPTRRSWPRDFFTYFLIPWLGSTLLFYLLIWSRDPPRFYATWPVGIVASGVFGFAAFLGYAHQRRKILAGPWRDFL